MGALMRAIDWSRTPIGPVESWSDTLCKTARLILANPLQMFLWWGPQFCQIYNDASWPALGVKHPRSMGQPAHECWSEIWHIIGPLIETPFKGGEATWMDDIALEINRAGFTGETHWTIAYGPVPDEAAPGGIGGVIGCVNEITEKVVGERRVLLLRDLGARSSEAKTAEEACRIAADTFRLHDADVPFALLYLVTGDRRRAQLAGHAGVSLDQAATWSDLPLDEAASPWPLGEALRCESMQVVEPLDHVVPGMMPGPWTDPPRMAVVCPVASNRAHQLAGLLVMGISSRLRFDDRYRGFCDLVVSQVATAIANARAYEEERKRAEALAEIDRAKTAFFSNVSHEFRTPLTLMLGPLEDMISGADDSVTVARGDLELIRRNGLRMKKLVNSLLDFARIEAGRVQASYEPVDVPRYTAELASVFRSAVEKAGMALLIDCPPLDEPVYVDRGMWEKIVLNLVSNALKFTFEGEIEVSTRRVDDCVELCVRDTGTGIAAEERPRVFERFHRIEGARGRTHEGSGIGLALVQELAKLHGGSVLVDSTLGEGSRFTVRVPMGHAHVPTSNLGPALASTAVESAAYVEEALRWLPDETDAPSPAVGKEAARRAKRARILLADDNADPRQYVKRLLGAAHDVVTATDGEAALAMARREVPDLVLTDVMMPRLDGFGLLDALRADARRRDIPVIMLSARAGEEARVGGLQAGATDYLVKPFSARELLARVQAALDAASASRVAVAREHALRKSAEQSASRTQRELAAEQTALTGLHELSKRLFASTALKPLLQEVLGATMSIESAECGFVQLLNPTSGDLEIVAHTGLNPVFAEHFRAIHDESTVCGRALAQGARVLVHDVRKDPAFAPHLAYAEAAGYRAVHCTPLLSRTGAKLGVISTYFAEPHVAQDRELRFTDLYARLAAELIERQRTEDALRESEERFRRYFDLGLIGMAITSPAKGCLEVNDELCRILGYERDELLALTWPEITYPEDLATDTAHFERVMAGDIDGYTIEKRWVRKDGAVIDTIMAARCVRHDDGAVDYFAGLVLDTTERKRSQERLWESERRFRLLAESIPHHVWSFVPTGAVEYCNQRLLDYTGLTREEVAAHGVWGSLHPADVDAVRTVWKEAIATASGFEIEQRLRGRDGMYRRFVSRGVAVMDKEGRPLAWFATNTDVEERRRTKEALDETRAELARVARVTTMGELAASIAHEVLQPLTAISTNASAGQRWLAADAPDLNEVARAFERIARDATRAGDVIMRIRKFLKREAVQRVPLDIHEIIVEVTALAHGEIEGAGVTLVAGDTDRLPPVHGDRVQLHQVLLNLVLNAIDAMRLVSERARVLQVSAQRHGAAEVEVRVRDSGVGIDASRRDRLFDPFHTTKPDGMGMGLVISRSIVEAHGGHLRATANPDYGETFHFTLPLATTDS